jgi:antitoxin HicB
MTQRKLARRAKRASTSSRRSGGAEEALALAIKRSLAVEIAQALKKADISQSELARRMSTSRAVVHRLLKGNDPSVTLATITRVATALGRKVKVTLNAK